jgi:TonB family protein
MNSSAAAKRARIQSPLTNYYQWAEPDSDITACLNLETIDRLQAEVLRGLLRFSTDRNEVGGILLGRTTFEEDRRLTFVEDFEVFPRERRGGPAYALSGDDEIRLETSLKRYTGGPALSAVGYFRSHNRDGLFLSADDLRVIERHFRDPHSVFLLIKTLPSGACTAGFFFWKGGRIQSEFTDSEVPLMPVSFALPDAAAEVSPAPIAEPAPTPRRDLRRLARPIAVTAVAAAVTLAVVRYEEARPANHPVSREERSIPAAQPAIQARPVAVRDSRPIAEPAPAAASRRHEPPEASPRREETEPNTPAVVDQTPLPAPPVTVATSTPPPSNPAALTAERPAEIAPVSPPVTTVPAPPPSPVPSASAPVPEKVVALPVTPPPAPPPPVSAASSSSTIPAVSAPTNTYVGPRVIHQATPAVPRGVAPMMTSDVEVDVAVTIDDKGRVTGARVASTRGSAAALLTIEALKAAQLFRFQPARDHDRNVAGSTILTFRFAKATK